MKNNNPLKYLLVPFSWIYGLIIFLRNKLFDYHILPEKKFDVPIISVGNITIGGTGKTPMVEYLVSLLKEEFKLAVLSRGYMRKTRGFVLADDNPSHIRIGDEPCQIKDKFPDITVAVDADRVNGIQKLLSLDKNIDLIILDDAFQHRYVKPGLSILLIDFKRPITMDNLLPYGRLRETHAAKKRADIIIITKTSDALTQDQQVFFIENLDPLSSQHLFFSTIIYESLRNVFHQNLSQETLKLLKRNPSVLLVCGIAVPSELKEFVTNISTDIFELFFPDHHNYTMSDIYHIQKEFNKIQKTDKIIITTEKDSVRFRQFGSIPEEMKMKMFYIPIKVAFLKEYQENFNQLIFNYVRTYKRNSLLYPEKDQTAT